MNTTSLSSDARNSNPNGSQVIRMAPATVPATLEPAPTWRERMTPHVRAMTAVLQAAAQANGQPITADEAEAIAWMAIGRTCTAVRSVALHRGVEALARGLKVTSLRAIVGLVVDAYEGRLGQGQIK